MHLLPLSSQPGTRYVRFQNLFSDESRFGYNILILVLIVTCLDFRYLQPL